LLKSVAGEAKVVGGLAGSDMDAGDELLLNSDRTPNRSGLAMLDLHEQSGAALAASIAAAKGAVLIHGGNPALDTEVAKAITAHGQVIYLGSHNNETAQLSDLVLPGATWAEKAGIFANKDGRLQGFKQSVARPGSSREDWRILAEMLGAEGPSSLKAVRVSLAEALNLSDVNLNKLPADGFATAAVVAGGDS